MARVQKVQPKKKNTNQASQKNAKSKTELAKTNPKREATKNEILFFRLGISIIALTIVVVTIIFIVQYFMNQEPEAGPYDDYMHITATELIILAGYDEIHGVYGDFSQLDGKEEYEDLKALIDGQTHIYFYFYRSSEINDPIYEAIMSVDNLEDTAFLFVDMDATGNGNLFEQPKLTHLELDQDRDNMLVIFEVEADEDKFETWVLTNHIVIEVTKLQS
ncbi:MAG: hypothetical protein NUK62_05750 [Tenericutes bacterium]|nr:hypothetical protein [Mycoplasmatota bacterium]